MSSLTVAHDNLVNLLSTAEMTKRYDAWYMEHREIFKAFNSKILETRSERDEHSSIISGRSKSSRASSQSSVAKRAEMLTKAARLETELKFLKIEQEKAAEFKKIQLMKEIATNQAEIEAATKLDEVHDVSRHISKIKLKLSTYPLLWKLICLLQKSRSMIPLHRCQFLHSTKVI